MTFEAAEWIVDGYDRGVYFNSAHGGKLVWDMATTEPGLQNKKLLSGTKNVLLLLYVI